VAKDRPDLILMELQLPVMDGYETTRRIKADPSMSTILIIAVTSYALGDEDARASLQRRPSDIEQQPLPIGVDQSSDAVPDLGNMRRGPSDIGK